MGICGGSNSKESDKDLVHDAWLETMNDPEKYSDFHIQLIEDLEYKFKHGEQTQLSAKQKKHVEMILDRERPWP